MKTDDFDDNKDDDALDAHDLPPEPLSAERDFTDDDGFNEFDAPPAGASTSAGSLGELWRNNPIIKIAVVVVGVLALIIAFIMFGGDDERPHSTVGTALDAREAPGNETSEAYREAINEVNQQRLEQAMRTGESTLPIPVATPTTTPPAGANEEPPFGIEDPLEGWRASTQTGGGQPTTLDPSSPQLVGTDMQQQQAMPMGPDPAAVDALAQAMSAQMQSILDKHQIRGPQIMQVTSIENLFGRDNAAGEAGGGVPVQEVREILIPAGTIVYAQTLTEANTDAPGPVLARLSSGPLTGARILGTFRETENYLTLQFNTVVVKGVSQSTNAVALDPKTTLPAVATEVDRRYWRRVILPAAARFIEGMGQAIAQREQTISVSNGTTIASQGDLNTRQELAAGLAAGTQQLGQELDREADRTRVMIKVHAGTPIGILFLDPVLKEE